MGLKIRGVGGFGAVDILMPQDFFPSKYLHLWVGFVSKYFCKCGVFGNDLIIFDKLFVQFKPAAQAI